MRTRLLAENPEKIEFTLKIEGTAKEFEAIRDALARLPPNMPAPVRQLESELNSLIGQARKIFWPTEPPKTIGVFMGAPVTVPHDAESFVVDTIRERLSEPYRGQSEFDGGTRDQFGPATP